MQLHINSNCNYNCIYCYRKKVKPLEAKKWLCILDEAKSLGVSYIEILGGEPFLDNNLERILDHAIIKDFKVTIYTNGLLINENWIKKLKSIKNKIIISIKYGYHKHVINNNDLEKNVKKVEGIITKLRNEDIPVVTFITVDNFNFPNLKEIINKAIDLKTFPLIERYVPVKEKIINSKFSLTKEQWHETLKIIRKVYSNYNSIIYGKSYSRGRTCNCYIDNLSITPDGYVLPCPFAPVSLNLGNIKNESLKGIWKNFLNKRKDWIKIPKGCKKCKNKYLCRGGCKTSPLLIKNDMSEKDPLCNGSIPTTFGHVAFSIMHDNKNAKLKKLKK